MKYEMTFRRHLGKCTWRQPPGREIYRKVREGEGVVTITLLAADDRAMRITCTLYITNYSIDKARQQKCNTTELA